MKKSFLFVLMFIFLFSLFGEESEVKPLPAWKAKDYQRVILNYKLLQPLSLPPAGSIYLPAEFAPVEGVIIQVPTGWGTANKYYAEMIKAIIDANATPYIIARSSSDITKITNNVLKPNGIDENAVEFLTYRYDANWTRDYGPWNIYVDGERAIVNNEYYDDRKNDNAINGQLAKLWAEEIFSTGLHTEGGNFMTDGLGTCWASTGVIAENTKYYGWTKAEIDAVYLDFLNCHNGIHYPEPLPDEGTTHIDMFSKILDQNTIIVSSSTKELGATDAEIAALDAAAYFYASVPKPDGGEWKIVRIPMTFDTQGFGSKYRVQYTHTNSTIVNSHVIVPIYGRGTDEEALEIYRSLMPRHTVVGVDSNVMITSGGAIHCTTMQLSEKEYSKCGNGVVDEDEECDTYYTNGVECKDLSGFSSGLLQCNSNCTFDTSLCNKDGSETPDNEQPDEESNNQETPDNEQPDKESSDSDTEEQEQSDTEQPDKEWGDDEQADFLTDREERGGESTFDDDSPISMKKNSGCSALML
ncbi:MAG: agmatine deiminase family protein [bacterium]